jgi:thiol-disulfide isomerase/thioredoxin
MKRNPISALALGLLLTSAKGALADPLSLGAPAPPIKVGGWAKGVPVTSFEPGKVYVVEFWATWCGPCKASIPHLTELRKKYMENVTFAGVSIWEKGSDTVQLVKKYVANEGNKMYYKVAYDTAAGDMAKSWMDAAGQQGVPTAFVIQDDKIMWIGDPMKGLDDVLAQVTAGTYDLAKAKADADAKLKAAAAGAAVDEQSAQQAFNEAITAEDYPKALTILDGFIGKHPEAEPRFVDSKIRVLLLIDKSKALAYVDSMGAKNPGVYYKVAAMLLHGMPPIAADPAIALTYAKKADESSGGKQPYYKILLALAYKVNGQQDVADSTFQAAIDLARQLGAPQQDIDTLTKVYQETK